MGTPFFINQLNKKFLIQDKTNKFDKWEKKGNSNSKTNLCDERSLRSKELSGQPDGVNNQGVLFCCFLSPSAADVRRTVVKNDVESHAAMGGHEALDLGLAFIDIGDILLDGYGASNGSDRNQIEAKDEAADGSTADSDLHPTTGGSAEVEDAAGGAEEAELAVELEKLPRGAGAVAMLLGKPVVLVQAMLSLHFFAHNCSERVLRMP